MASWNLQEKIDLSTLKFSVPQSVQEKRDMVLRFIESHVYPLEEKMRQKGMLKDVYGSSPASPDEDDGAVRAFGGRVDGEIREVQAEAKRLGLWALGHPTDIGGGGMPFRDYIYASGASCNITGTIFFTVITCNRSMRCKGAASSAAFASALTVYKTR